MELTLLCSISISEPGLTVHPPALVLVVSALDLVSHHLLLRLKLELLRLTLPVSELDPSPPGSITKSVRDSRMSVTNTVLPLDVRESADGSTLMSSSMPTRSMVSPPST